MEGEKESCVDDEVKQTDISPSTVKEETHQSSGLTDLDVDKQDHAEEVKSNVEVSSVEDVDNPGSKKEECDIDSTKSSKDEKLNTANETEPQLMEGVVAGNPGEEGDSNNEKGDERELNDEPRDEVSGNKPAVEQSSSKPGDETESVNLPEGKEVSNDVPGGETENNIKPDDEKESNESGEGESNSKPGDVEGCTTKPDDKADPSNKLGDDEKSDNKPDEGEANIKPGDEGHSDNKSGNDEESHKPGDDIEQEDTIRSDNDKPTDDTLELDVNVADNKEEHSIVEKSPESSNSNNDEKLVTNMESQQMQEEEISDIQDGQDTSKENETSNDEGKESSGSTDSKSLDTVQEETLVESEGSHTKEDVNTQFVKKEKDTRALSDGEEDESAKTTTESNSKNQPSAVEDMDVDETEDLGTNKNIKPDTIEETCVPEEKPDTTNSESAMDVTEANSVEVKSAEDGDSKNVVQSSAANTECSQKDSSTEQIDEVEGLTEKIRGNIDNQSDVIPKTTDDDTASDPIEKFSKENVEESTKGIDTDRGDNQNTTDLVTEDKSSEECVVVEESTKGNDTDRGDKQNTTDLVTEDKSSEERVDVDEKSDDVKESSVEMRDEAANREVCADGDKQSFNVLENSEKMDDSDTVLLIGGEDDYDTTENKQRTCITKSDNLENTEKINISQSTDEKETVLSKDSGSTCTGTDLADNPKETESENCSTSKSILIDSENHSVDNSTNSETPIEKTDCKDTTESEAMSQGGENCDIKTNDINDENSSLQSKEDSPQLKQSSSKDSLVGEKRKLDDLEIDSMYDENSKDVLDMETDDTEKNADDVQSSDANNENDEKDALASKAKSSESVPTPAKRFRQSIALMNAAQGLHRISAHQIYEYQWPADGGEYYILQEQVSEYLGVKSFKRKYPDLFRRAVDLSEREFLREKGVVTETQCDLGLTALKGEEVYDLMHKDYPDQYKEYADVLHEREKQKIKNKQKCYEQLKLEKSKMRDYIKKSVKSASEYNKLFNRKRQERRAYFDLQTYAIHYPQGHWKKPAPEDTKPSIYPVALIPGQFQEYYKPYTPDELKYYPVRSTLYGPPKNMDNSDCEAETNEDAEESNEEVDDSGTDDGSDDESSSDSDDDITLDQIRSKEKITEEEKEEEEKVEENKCKICKLGAGEKVEGKIQEMIQCSECKSNGHSTCFEITPDVVSVIKTYPWQCMECKTCVECMDPFDEDKMMFCDRCDRGYHTFCVGLKSIPKGHWECVSCKAPSTPPPPKARRGRPPLNRTTEPPTNEKISTPNSKNGSTSNNNKNNTSSTSNNNKNNAATPASKPNGANNNKTSTPSNKNNSNGSTRLRPSRNASKAPDK